MSSREWFGIHRKNHVQVDSFPYSEMSMFCAQNADSKLQVAGLPILAFYYCSCSLKRVVLCAPPSGFSVTPSSSSDFSRQHSNKNEGNPSPGSKHLLHKVHFM